MSDTPAPPNAQPPNTVDAPWWAQGAEPTTTTTTTPGQGPVTGTTTPTATTTTVPRPVPALPAPGTRPTLIGEQNVMVRWHFDDVFDLYAPDDTPISVDEAADILEDRLTKETGGLEGAAYSFGTFGGTLYDYKISAGLARRLAELIPEELRREVIVNEMWTLPLLAAVARGSDLGATVNGVAFADTDVLEARSLFDELRGSMVENMIGEQMVPPPDAAEDWTPPSEEVARRVAVAALDDYLDPANKDLLVPISPSYPQSKIMAALEIEHELDRTKPAPERTPASSAAGFDPGAAAAGAAPRVPQLTQDSIEEMFRASLMDWEGFLQASFPDPETGVPQHSVELALEQDKPTPSWASAMETGVRQAMFPAQRTYSALEMTNLLWTMAEPEIVAIQDKLARAGYIDPEQEIRRGDPGDAATVVGWRNLLADSVRRGLAPNEVLRRQVKLAMTLDEAKEIGDTWAMENLGRRLSRGEAIVFRNYATSLGRPTSAGRLDMGSQLSGYLQDRYGDEASARTTQVGALDHEGWARAWAEDNGWKRGQADG